MASFKPKKKLTPPEKGSDFAFPFLAYDIQLDFMQTLYTVLHSEGIGIFESPTGTGKSLSLTCGTLTWLKDYARLVEEELHETIGRLRNEITRLEKENERSSDWITGQYNAMGQRKELDELNGFKQSMEEHRKHLVQMKEQAVLHNIRWEKARSKDGTLKEEPLQQDVIIDEDEHLIPEESDDSDGEPDLGGGKDEEERYRPVQVIYCSRTHSQLSQVVNEVKETQHAKDLRLVSLASRQSLCINAEVRKLKTNTLINERCLELLKKGRKSKSNSGDGDGPGTKKRRKIAQSCPYYNQRAIEGLKSGILFEVPDIEDLVRAGKRESACPYYASRAAIPDAQVLMVPYQLILHRRTRQQSGIELRDAILIIDEAHNLLDTIAAIHSQEVRQEQLRQAKLHLSAYKARYFSRFSTKNLLRINQVIFIATRLEKLLSTEGQSSRMLQTQELLLEADIFNLNLPDILAFCDRSRIAQKVHGFAQSAPRELLDTPNVASVRRKVGTTSKGSTSALKSLLKNLEQDNKGRAAPKKKDERGSESGQVENDQENDQQVQAKPPVTNAVRPLINFLECLMEDGSGDSRVLLSFDEKDPSQACMKYLLLNPGARFEEIVQSCRSVVLAGGTMQPTEELTEQVFRHHRDRVTIRSYPHVVPKDAVLPIALGRGPTGKEFLFNFANKQNVPMLEELQSTLLNISQVVPNGIVVFFSSYDFLDQFYRKLEESGNHARLEERKKVFREPKTSGQVERILHDYARAARSATGAILFSVVGGKLSEGLNFSDELGRCVVVVGLPYPNRTSAELNERMRYLDRCLTASGVAGSSPGNEYYENLCMKAVNQCIGRAVRHIRDYAAVILLDTRYCTGERIRRKLPVWISERMECVDQRYGQAHGMLVKFFRQHKLKA
ncbi:ATP-dependent DNA helicase DDX11 [Anopheles stephensi]|uniref:DNA 5'-3' helicase n=1 Tax=Anopheles stephensi TaxID=30069 RepID=A0A182YAG2_ANOST|nr:ATP-dependent DNA helicase DDX11 [Anopheles stephensi]XP_035897669.1 ATP-dependent DNA helicase DDX11 [Anopheles stephensi]